MSEEPWGAAEVFLLLPVDAPIETLKKAGSYIIEHDGRYWRGIGSIKPHYSEISIILVISGSLEKPIHTVMTLRELDKFLEDTNHILF